MTQKGTGTPASAMNDRQVIESMCARNNAVELHHRNRMDELTVSRSRLLVLDESGLYIDRPQCIGESVQYAAGQVLDVYFNIDNTLQMFRTTVLATEVVVSLNTSKKVVGMLLAPPDKLNLGQRRLNFRVSLISAEEIAVDLHGSSEPDPNACPLNAKRFTGKLVDLSLGGAAIRVRGALYSQFRVGEHFFMSFRLPGEPGEMRYLAQVRQSRDILDGAATRLGVCFTRWPNDLQMRQQAMAMQRVITRMQRAMLKRAG